MGNSGHITWAKHSSHKCNATAPLSVHSICLRPKNGVADSLGDF